MLMSWAVWVAIADFHVDKGRAAKSLNKRETVEVFALLHFCNWL